MPVLGPQIQRKPGMIRGREFAYTAGGVVEKQVGGVLVMAGYQRYLSFLGGIAPGGGTAGVQRAAAKGESDWHAERSDGRLSVGASGRLAGRDFRPQRFSGRELGHLYLEAELDTRGIDSFLLCCRIKHVPPEISVPLLSAQHHPSRLVRFTHEFL